MRDIRDMQLLNHRTVYSSLFYILIIVLVIIAKPAFAFDENGEIKSFGVGDQTRSIVSLGVVSTVFAIVSFYIFTIIDIVFGEKIPYTYSINTSP